MKATLLVTIAMTFLAASPALAQPNKLLHAKDGSGVPGYKHTPIQPWSGFHVHDPDRPAPPVVEAGQPSTQTAAGSAPSDAIVLFDGKDLSAWKPADWKVADGCMVATGGLLLSQQQFGDCQLHVEWSAPVEDEENRMNQGNNGVQLLGGVEVQIFDSNRVKLYPDGQAAAIYAQTPPMVNACRKPGEWQTFDIVLKAPRFSDSGKLTEPARITMFHNGLLVHLNQEIYGHSPHLRLASNDSIQPQGPVGLMAHHCPVRFRNIWIRPLDLAPGK
jgi:hypothetical protein